LGQPPGGEPPRRQRHPRARVTPEALARTRGDAREGLDWLGRAPESHATPVYRVARFIARLVLFGVLRFRIETAGRERLPGGGYLLIAAAHRGWMDPFVVLHALPPEPRAWFLGSAASTFTSRWREWLVRTLGGLLPVWRGGVRVDQHVASARAVLANGGVFVQMPEGTVSGPPGRLGPFRIGAALIALRTGAPIVPFAIAGTEELYLGKRMASRILAPTSVVDLLGESWDGTKPPPDSRAELELARRLTDRLAALIGPAVEELHPVTVDPPGHRRLARRRLTWLFLARGPLDRDSPQDGSADAPVP
jgi:1-acyl-sn-glycerol-3-phosphate acyltransferase